MIFIYMYINWKNNKITSRKYLAFSFKCSFENFPIILDWVVPGAGFCSGGASANILEGGGGKEGVDHLFNLLGDGFVDTVFIYVIL